MGLTKLDRANRAKIQTISYDPNGVGTSTRGNIAIDTSTGALYFKVGSTWYAANGATGGVFEAGAGSYSAKRIGVATSTTAGDYSFSMGPGNTVTGDYSAAFGTGITITAGLNFAAGSAHSLGASSNYNAVFGSTQTISASSSYNLVGGYNHTLTGDYNLVIGQNHTIATSIYSSLIGGNGHSINSMTSSVVAGINNTIDSSCSLTLGRDNENEEDYTIVYGRYAKAIWPGARHFAGVSLDGSTAGTCQGMDGLVLVAQTSGAETILMTLNSLNGSGTNPLYCPDGHTIVFDIRIVGISSSAAIGIEVFEYHVIMQRSDPTFNSWIRNQDWDGYGSSNVMDEGSNIGGISFAEDSINYKTQINAEGTAGITTNWIAYISSAIDIEGSYVFPGS